MRLHVDTAQLGKLVKVGQNIYVIKTLVGIGGGGGKLTHTGLRQRLLTLAAESQDDILQTDALTTQDMLEEESEYLCSVQKDEVDRFGIDTTTTVIKLEDGSLVLHSPAEATEELRAAVGKVGKKVTAIIAPNLQHWLGCASWAALYPQATVFVAPPAMGECLVEKLPAEMTNTVTVLEDKGSIFDGQLQYLLLKGAPLMLNEVVFLHEKSSTLIVADAFYSGHCCGQEETTGDSLNQQKTTTKSSKHDTVNSVNNSLSSDMEINHRSKYEHQLNNTQHNDYQLQPPNVFTRVWFKLTKEHWCSSQLPSYRTSRVLSDGDPDQLLASIREIISIWAPQQMVCAHGDRVIDNNPGEALISAWTDGVIISAKDGF